MAPLFKLLLIADTNRLMEEATESATTGTVVQPEAPTELSTEVGPLELEPKVLRGVGVHCFNSNWISLKMFVVAVVA